LSDRPALIRLLGLLREIDAIPAKPPLALDELEQIVQDFDRYLIQERGLARVSAVRDVPFARQFLREHCLSGYPQIASLTGSDVMTFIERHARDHSPQSAKHMCSAIRAFMRFLQYRGYIAADLASCVPGVRAWQLTSLPTYLLPDQVQTAPAPRYPGRKPLDYRAVLTSIRFVLQSGIPSARYPARADPDGRQPS
ncbi:MAG: hypothetical protein QOF46_3790, partial [Paraburkholderia sp.]|nr:hypothetical protein [Paraburkholderia sp.]